MKKIIYLLSILLMSCCLVTAQLPANRTVSTKVADALAQLPAQQQQQYNAIMTDLLSTGEEGVFTMIKMINAPGKGSNASIDFALSGLSRFATGEGREKDRQILANAYCKALNLSPERETQAFILRQIAIVGKDECVTMLVAYLKNDNLSGPAARALASIHTPAAQKALADALPTTAGNANKMNIIKALGDMETQSAESALQAMLGSSDKDMEKETLYALSRCGTKASLPLLAKAAEKVGYTLDYTGANEAYILLIKRVLKQGNTKEAEKASNDLLKKATKANQAHTRGAALEILLAAKPGDRNKQILKALDDPDKAFRNVALSNTPADASLIQAVAGKLKKADTDTKADILNWLGDQRAVAVLPLITSYINDNSQEVVAAAISAVMKIGDSSSIPVLTNLLTSENVQKAALGKSALASFKGNISPEVAKIFTNGTTTGKVAAMELLALRKADAYSNEIFSRLSDPDAKLKAAALDALNGVVTEKDLSRLYSLLEIADTTSAASLQQAVIAALSTQPVDQQFATIISRMSAASENKKHLYYIILANTGKKQALPVIKAGLGEGSETAKKAAYDAYIQLIASPSYTPENKVIFLRDIMDFAKTDEQKKDVLKRLGNTGTFQALIYTGDFLDNPALQQTAANAVMSIALNHPQYTGDAVKELLSKSAVILNNPDAEYQRQAIRKHLSEMPDEKGFTPLFNGRNLTGWKGLVKNPIARSKMKPGELKVLQAQADRIARAAWVVENGSLVFTGKGDNLCTDKQYGDFEMYIDWKLYPGPEPDAGIYLRGTPQVQIWDTSRVNVGAQVGSGGLYNNAVNPNNPVKVADNPVNEWNSFYIRMVGERVTVYLNGELVVNNVILENYWDRKLPIFQTEQIELQAHGSKVAYRDIYIREIERVKPYQLPDAEKKEGFQVLFDGTTMNEWTGNTTDYTTKDGCIVLNPAGKSGGNLYTKKEYANFIYRFEFQLTPAANNGIGIRTPLEGDAAYVGMEIQVLDSEAPVYKNLQQYQYHGSVYGIIPAKRGFLKPVGEWNTEEIYANGDQIRVTLNGEVILDGNIREATKDGTPDHKEHPGLFNKKGHIGFLGHGSEVKFRNIRIKELPDK